MLPQAVRPLLILGLGVLLLALGSSPASAHNAGDCSGGNALWWSPGLGEHRYFTSSSCGTGWDAIGVAAVLVRASGSNFVLQGIVDKDIDFNDDYVDVHGGLNLGAGQCYLMVGVHAAADIHFTAVPPHESHWLQFDFTLPVCA